jgi:hypothetical protein
MAEPRTFFASTRQDAVNGVIGFADWAPTITALSRHVPNRGSVVVVNLFLGWTVVGWVVALAMACRSKPTVAAGPAIPQLPQSYERDGA